MRLLVVEDDRLLNNTLCYNLYASGYTVDSAVTSAEAVRFFEAQDYDLIVLDVNLPDGNGFDFCEQIKERRPDTAVIFLTANDMESDMLKGFELGADDYVTKPFTTMELLARVNLILQKTKKEVDTLKIGKTKINLCARSVFISDREVELTPQEFELLEVLVRNRNIALSREQLLELA